MFYKKANSSCDNIKEKYQILKDRLAKLEGASKEVSHMPPPDTTQQIEKVSAGDYMKQRSSRSDRAMRSYSRSRGRRHGSVGMKGVRQRKI